MLLLTPPNLSQIPFSDWKFANFEIHATKILIAAASRLAKILKEFLDSLITGLIPSQKRPKGKRAGEEDL